ncbi:rare lipo protein A [Thamnocephalis sphaerospora]|uniref:Rare lipo protein A n=1 Tax=Thamnocephalis sphaerospora TaxID=78915 RepID=A0A4P9XSI3_9FUNG|nr:rare lipo protein A [Thamnocephalis sphaerospora]|eukprot:RKP09104.1 rare lipo protein A [Thamnocephalis sphaerospora]
MRLSAALLLFAASLASLTPQNAEATAVSLRRRGDGTYYDIEAGLTACGERHTNKQLYAAVASSWFTKSNPNRDPICKKCALVKGPKGQVKVRINDKCPECSRDSIDLTPAAFDKIAKRKDGRVKITWSFTAC